MTGSNLQADQSKKLNGLAKSLEEVMELWDSTMRVEFKVDAVFTIVEGL